MVAQPSGTVTLVFTDIEGSTRLLRELGQDSYREALAEHRQVVRKHFGAHGGYEVDHEGDAFFYTFPSASRAVAAVEQAMAALEATPVRIRVGIHTGEPGLDPPKYVGMDVHRAARVMAAAHGGQVLLTRATRNLVDVVVRDLGEHRLKDLEAPVALFQLGGRMFPPLRTTANTNLPRPASTFVGRQREVGELIALLRKGARLVTLSGPGGSGKTRLAIEAAAQLGDDFKAGVYWVGLASISDRALVLGTVANALGAKGDLAGWIAERELLLLLDNFEHVVDAAPELAGLVEACPKLRVLVTSRERLRVRGEVDYPVLPLAEAEALELFSARSLMEADADVAELCRRLDNLPLALELAAARTAVLSPSEILDRLSARLDLLKGGRDADPRQQTLRATIEWSYGLLGPAEQRLFTRLAIFRGGATLDATEEVTDADIDTLQSLVDKSLLRHGGERFWMLETIRDYALAHLDEATEPQLRERHANYFLTMAEDAVAVVDRGADRRPFVARLSDELENMRTALVWYHEQGRAEQLARLAVALYQYWIICGPMQEARQWLTLAVEQTGMSPPWLRRKALSTLAYIEFLQGDVGSARLHAESALEEAEKFDDADAKLAAINIATLIWAADADLEGARALYHEGIALARATNNEYRLALLLSNLAERQLIEGKPQEARSTAAESLALLEDSLHNEWFASAPRRVLATCAVLTGDHIGGLTHIRRALPIAIEFNDPIGLRACSYLLAAIDAASGQYDRAAWLLGAAEALEHESGALSESMEVIVRSQTETLLSSRRSDRLDEARRKGRNSSFDAISALAIDALNTYLDPQ